VVWQSGSRHPLLVIRRRLGFGVSLAYVPWGPDLPQDFPADPKIRNAALEELAEALKGFLPRDTVFIRFDPPWYSEGPGTPPPELGSPFVRAAADIQAPDTVLVDLEGTWDAVLGRMKNKWRYNSRLAQKRGVVIRRPDEKGLDIFYSLLKETARRDRISIHQKEYYKTLFSHCREYQEKLNNPANVPAVHLYTADHEGDTLAAIVVLFRGKEGIYLYGASSNNKRNLMAPYALQVRAMEDAKKMGCVEYDLFGIPPHEDPSHPMAGLYRFKTGFGGRIVHRPGSWDYSYRNFTMKLFYFLESLRKKYRDRKKRAPKEDIVKETRDA
jgi:lipid II:glycine glycyltransferase (peptidoglycan interpeptide bridge formation enzyme)